MIHCSFVEGFSSPLNNGLLVLGVEGFVAFEELNLRLHLTPMSFVLNKIMRFGFEKEEDNEKNGEREAVSFLLYLGHLLFSL